MFGSEVKPNIEKHEEVNVKIINSEVKYNKIEFLKKYHKCHKNSIVCKANTVPYGYNRKWKIRLAGYATKVY